MISDNINIKVDIENHIHIIEYNLTHSKKSISVDFTHDQLKVIQSIKQEIRNDKINYIIENGNKE